LGRRRLLKFLGLGLLVVGIIRFVLAHPSTKAVHTQQDTMLRGKKHDRHGKPVSVGFCVADESDPFEAGFGRAVMTEIVEAALPGKWIQWRNLTRDGLPKNNEAFPDVSICFVGDFAAKATVTRFDSLAGPGEAPPHFRNDDMDVWRQGIFRPDDLTYVPHIKGRPMLIGINTDPWRSDDCSHLDLLVDTKQAHPFYGCPSVYVPPALLQLLQTKYNPFLKEEKEAGSSVSSVVVPKSQAEEEERKFCVLYCDSCSLGPTSMDEDGVVMWSFLSILKEAYKPCDVIGSCKTYEGGSNPDGGDKEAGSGSGSGSGSGGGVFSACSIAEQAASYKARLELYRKYRFVVAFENVQLEGWVTDDVVLAAEASSVPIFWGDEGIGKRVNEARIVNINDYVGEDHVLTIRDSEDMADDDRIAFAVSFLRKDMRKAVDAIRSLDEDANGSYTGKLQHDIYQVVRAGSESEEAEADTDTGNEKKQDQEEGIHARPVVAAASDVRPGTIAEVLRVAFTELDSYVVRDEK